MAAPPKSTAKGPKAVWVSKQGRAKAQSEPAGTSSPSQTEVVATTSQASQDQQKDGSVQWAPTRRPKAASKASSSKSKATDHHQYCEDDYLSSLIGKWTDERGNHYTVEQYTEDACRVLIGRRTGVRRFSVEAQIWTEQTSYGTRICWGDEEALRYTADMETLRPHQMHWISHGEDRNFQWYRVYKEGSQQFSKELAHALAPRPEFSSAPSTEAASGPTPVWRPVLKPPDSAAATSLKTAKEPPGTEVKKAEAPPEPKTKKKETASQEKDSPSSPPTTTTTKEPTEEKSTDTSHGIQRPRGPQSPSTPSATQKAKAIPKSTSIAGLAAPTQGFGNAKAAPAKALPVAASKSAPACRYIDNIMVPLPHHRQQAQAPQPPLSQQDWAPHAVERGSSSSNMGRVAQSWRATYKADQQLILNEGDLVVIKWRQAPRKGGQWAYGHLVDAPLQLGYFPTAALTSPGLTQHGSHITGPVESSVWPATWTLDEAIRQREALVTAASASHTVATAVAPASSAAKEVRKSVSTSSSSGAFALNPYAPAFENPAASAAKRSSALAALSPRLACASPRCRFLVHSDGRFGGYCCFQCYWSTTDEHSWMCEQEVANLGTQRAERAPPVAPPALMEGEERGVAPALVAPPGRLVSVQGQSVDNLDLHSCAPTSITHQVLECIRTQSTQRLLKVCLPKGQANQKKTPGETITIVHAWEPRNHSILQATGHFMRVLPGEQICVHWAQQPEDGGFWAYGHALDLPQRMGHFPISCFANMEASL